ncbi:MAG: peptidoglycan DD-metalloendopeptidase family protein [Granulosicoccaceae bacterium]
MIHNTHGYRPHNVDFKSSRRTGGTIISKMSGMIGSNNGLKNKMQHMAPRSERFNRLSRSSAPMGAVRINAKSNRRFFHVGEHHVRKLYIALVVIAGGILVTTSSTGKDERPTQTIAVLSISPPTFFFDDTSNALGDSSVLADAKPVSNNTGVQLGQEGILERTLMKQLHSLTPAQIAAETAANSANKTVPLSSPVLAMVNQPAIAALRKNTTAPEGSSETVVRIKSGDTLSRILNDRGVKVDQMPKLLVDDIVKKYLSNLRIGQELEIVQLANGSFHSLSTRVGKDRRITIRKSTGGFATASIDLPVEKERVVTSGTIEQSLFIAAEQAKLKQSTIMELADIFQWELDFARDIRKGDQFSLVYDRLYREGKYIGDGEILAAEFIRGGRSYRAVRFTSPEGDTGYFTPDGQSKRRTFLRHPVDVVRITSKFDPNRVHPVLHKIRAHKGVDYGSPYGSPIRATADGKVSYSGAKNAYGNTVILKHGNNVSTLYAHMSKISSKSKVGKRVKQGDVIGYVGKTGRVTGTHLHYEFRRAGKHVDPLKVEFPQADPLPKKHRAQLRSVSDELLSQMRSVVPISAQIAAAD